VQAVWPKISPRAGPAAELRLPRTEHSNQFAAKYDAANMSVHRLQLAAIYRF
jgi:hypothetical protein